MSSRRGNDINFDELYSLKVDNLPYNTSVHELRRLFDRYGDIGDIPRDRYNNQSRGFGFVRFYSRKDADYACSRADGKQMNGRELRVSIAKYRRPLDEGRDRDRRRRSRSRSRRRSRTRSPPRRSRSRDDRSRSRSPRGRSRSRSERRGDESRSRSPHGHSRSRSPSRSRSLSRSPRD
ncbi:unnamed protein product [Meloidogyne enterolobii]|uniref:Uncharacterized protein n=1 Tax=Meloidogyne enterolobii TaxID=390850 RepID=A0ACB0YNU9_MELEN